MADPIDRPRWGQLTYTSFDRHDGRGGGWQVKDTTGALSAAETELLRGRVETQFDAGVELPRFPTPDQILELPRRLVYAAAGSAAETALWHHVPAGTDASGRPGNVFAHVVLDRQPTTDDPVRPIERWRSDDWLAPFGTEKVLAAELTSTVPPDPGALSRQTIASWLFAPRQWRMRTLTVLLDAVRQALRGGPMVVLGVSEVDEGANWLAAISFAMSAATARRFFFSTLERPTGLDAALKRSIHVVCMPRADLAQLGKRSGIVVIDPAAEIELGDLDGEPHRTARGDEITVGEWSVLITELFADPATMIDAINGFDRLARSVGDTELDAAWPAAMQVSQIPDAGGRAEAGRVMAESAPPQLRSHPELFDSAVAAMRRNAGGSVSRAWKQVQRVGADASQTGPATVSGEVAVRVYAELALAQESWLAETGPARLPSNQYYCPAPDTELVALALLLAPEISPFTPDLEPEVALAEARAGLHFVELAVRMGLAHDEGLMARLWEVVNQSIVPMLLDAPMATRLLDSVGRTVSNETRHWLWGQLGSVDLEALGPPGQRLADAVLECFGPGPDDPDPLAEIWPWLEGQTNPAPISPLITELAWYRNRLGDRRLDNRFLIAWSAVEVYARNRDPRALAEAERQLQPIWPTERLLKLAQTFGTQVPGQFYLSHLIERPGDAADQGLWELLSQRSDEAPITGLAMLRKVMAGDEWVGFFRPANMVEDLVEMQNALAVARQQRLRPDPGFLAHADGLVALALIAARGRTPGMDAHRVETLAGAVQAAIASWAPTNSGFTAAESAAVVRWCDTHGVDSTALTELLLLADPRSALRTGQDPVAGWLHSFGTGGSESPPITAMVLASRLSRSAESRDGVADQVLLAARTAPGATDDRASRGAERFLQGWIRQAQTGQVRR